MPEDKNRAAQLTISRELFDKFFLLDEAGHLVAIDALAAGFIETPYEVIEVVCLVNRLFASMVVNRVLEESEPSGKAHEYATAGRLRDRERSTRILAEAFGGDGITKIVPEVMRQLRDDIGVPELEPSATRRAPSTRKKRSSKHFLSWLAEEDVTEAAVLTTSEADFERHFKLEGPGCWIAKEAFEQGVIGTPYEMVDLICAAEKSWRAKVLERLEAAVAEHDQASEMRAATDSEALANLTLANLGTPTLEQLISGSVRDAAEEFHVSMTGTTARVNEKYDLWSAAADESPS